MLLNATTVLVCGDCWLVPYRKEHVARYHRWFLDHPELLGLTGSEPLSLDEEYEMQQSWREDANKCTFIILCIPNDSATLLPKLKDGGVLPKDFITATLPYMVGDVNLFFSDCEEETGSPESSYLQAEVDIMIAEPDFRRRGLGATAVQMMLGYAQRHVPSLRRWFCKIQASNKPSLRLFEETLGFARCAYAACFDEVELERTVCAPQDLDVGWSTDDRVQQLECPESMGGPGKEDREDDAKDSISP